MPPSPNHSVILILIPSSYVPASCSCVRYRGLAAAAEELQLTGLLASDPVKGFLVAYLKEIGALKRELALASQGTQ